LIKNQAKTSNVKKDQISCKQKPIQFSMKINLNPSQTSFALSSKEDNLFGDSGLESQENRVESHSLHEFSKKNLGKILLARIYNNSFLHWG